MRPQPLLRPALAAVLLPLFSLSAAAQNPLLSDDFDRIIGWLTAQTAQGIGFNAGSTFDPPNEMKAWRMQPDISLGIGVMPFDKSVFPKMGSEMLEDLNPKEALPDDVKFPNLTFHVRLGLPKRLDLGVRVVNMTIPKGYRLSDKSTGDGQSNTIGLGLRRHFFGGRRPLLSVSAFYNHVFGYFNFVNKFKNIELTDGFFASSTNKGQLEWDVTSIGANFVVSQVYGKWTPFLGMGFSITDGKVDGRLESNWETPTIKSSLGTATAQPESSLSRVIFGFQRDGSFFHFFLNGEVKATGFQAGRAFVVSTGLAAPFKIGANNSIARERKKSRGGNWLAGKPKDKDRKPARRPPEDLSEGDWLSFDAAPKHRVNRYWLWGRRTGKTMAFSPREDSSELIFLR